MDTSSRLTLRPFRESLRRAWHGLRRRWAAALPAPARTPPRRFAPLQRLENRDLLSASPLLLLRSAPGAPNGNLPSTAALLANLDRHRDPPGRAAVTAAHGPAAAGEAVRHELVIIDPRVANYQQLAAGLAGGGPGKSVQVVVLDGTRDGVDQVSQVLARYRGLDAVHIVSHGGPGEVQLGSTWLDTGDLSRYAAELRGWSRSLNRGADLLFYGCDVAATGEGQALLRRVGKLTGADVAGSTDPTGSAAEGGNWTLEYQTGPIHTAVPFTQAALDQWQGLLPTFTVITNSDSGLGSLRQAITLANLFPGTNTIAFNIGGSGTHTITLATALPAITGTVTIDGYTQPGSGPNTLAAGDNAVPLIVLNGASAGAGVDGLVITGSNCVVRGLVINHFSNNGLTLRGNNNLVAGNFLGTNVPGAGGQGNGNDGVLSTGRNNTIGGTTAAARNLISGNANRGVEINGASGNLVQGNFIGTDLTGTVALGNGADGVVLDFGGANTVGGTTAGARNVISGNLGNGIAASGAGASGNVIEGNYIGTDVTGTAPLGNGANGVSIDVTAPSTTVGGTAAGAGNLIADNAGDGVVVTTGGSNNAVLGNSIYGSGQLGIDLNNDGVTANTGTTNAALANDGMNFPVLTSAVDNGATLKVTGYVGTAPGQATFAGARVQIFQSDNDPSGYGEGKTYLGTLTADAAGNFSGTLAANGVNVGDTITATATDASGNTSEFGQDVVTTLPVNDPPVNTVPGTQSVPRNTDVVFSTAGGNPISVSDGDALATDNIQVSLSVTAFQAIQLSTTNGLTFVAGSDDQASMTFQGTLANINTALDGLRLQPDSHFTGVATLTIMSNDLGNRGTGGPMTATSVVDIDVGIAPNTTSVASSQDPSVYGQAVTFTATVSAVPLGLPVPTGTVTFLDGSATLGTASLVGGTASFTTAALAAGSHDITATYSGDAVFAPSTSGTLTQTVTPAPLTVTANDASKVYGQPDPGFTASYSGFVNGDTTASLSGAPSLTTTATAASHAGTYTITAGPGTLSDPNYTFTFVNGTLTVTAAPLTITANNVSKVYGQPNPPLTASYTGLVNGDTPAALGGSPSLSTTASTGSAVGSYTITAGPGTLNDPDYSFTFVNGTLTVTPAALTVTANDATKVYGQPNPAFSASYSGFVNGDTPASLGGALTFATTATAASGAGPYAVTPGGLTSTNYAISFSPGTLTVTPAALTVTANDASKVYGQRNPAFTASYSGFVNGDTTASLSGSPSLTTAGSHVGSYAITAGTGTLSDPNYSFTFVNGTLTITPAPLTVSSSATRAYGQPNRAARRLLHRPGQRRHPGGAERQPRSANRGAGQQSSRQLCHHGDTRNAVRLGLHPPLRQRDADRHPGAADRHR